MGRFYEKGEIIPEGQRNMGKDTRINLFGIINQFSLHMRGCFIRKNRKSLLKPFSKRMLNSRLRGLYGIR